METNIIESKTEGGRTRLTADHGLVDDRGRTVGGFAEIRLMPSIEAMVTSGYRPEYAARVGGKYEVVTVVTRDGRGFGSAFPKGTFYVTLAAASHAAQKKLAAQRTRLAKKFAVQEVA